MPISFVIDLWEEAEEIEFPCLLSHTPTVSGSKCSQSQSTGNFSETGP